MTNLLIIITYLMTLRNFNIQAMNLFFVIKECTSQASAQGLPG